MTFPRQLLSYFYILMAFLGAILTISANIDFINNYGPGFDIRLFINLANINPAAKSLSRDLFISSSAIFVWIVSEAKRLQVKKLWLVVITTFTIAFAFSAPLFLFLRERRLIEIENSNFND